MRLQILMVLISLFPFVLMAQEDEGEKALKKVLEVLTVKEPQLPDVTQLPGMLQKGAWEALSYINEGAGEYDTDDLLEAVPDYYNFGESEVIIKLIDPNDYNQYGIEVTVKYRVLSGKVELLNPQGELKSSWELLYLDKHYMALDMGELRVFFTHTPVQE
ncbi:MAG: hypothetical protein ACPF9D_00110 [Owenweeksia sp.]